MDAHNDNDWTMEEMQRELQILEQTECPLCAGPLNHSHSTDHANWLVKEESGCPHCFVRMKTKVHIMH